MTHTVWVIRNESRTLFKSISTKKLLKISAAPEYPSLTPIFFKNLCISSTVIISPNKSKTVMPILLDAITWPENSLTFWTYAYAKLKKRERCLFQVGVDSILFHADFGPNEHRRRLIPLYIPHFMTGLTRYLVEIRNNGDKSDRWWQDLGQKDTNPFTTKIYHQH